MPALTLERPPVHTPTGSDRAPSGRHSTETDRPGRRWWPVGLAIVVVLVTVSLVLPAGRHQWALSFVRQPAPFTTLSFNDAAHLPTSVPAGGSMPISVSVANNEGHTLRYQYVVTSTSGHRAASVLHRGVLAVPAGARRSASIRVKPVCATSPCRVEVSLPGHPETIDALVDVAPAN